MRQTFKGRDIVNMALPALKQFERLIMGQPRRNDSITLTWRILRASLCRLSGKKPSCGGNTPIEFIQLGRVRQAESFGRPAGKNCETIFLFKTFKFPFITGQGLKHALVIHKCAFSASGSQLFPCTFRLIKPFFGMSRE